MRNSDRAWVALACGVAAYDLIAADDEQLTNAARRYFKSQPIVTASTILVTGMHLIGGIPPWCDPIALTFAAYRRGVHTLRHIAAVALRAKPSLCPAPARTPGPERVFDLFASVSQMRLPPVLPALPFE
jgi:hypothetical protein